MLIKGSARSSEKSAASTLRLQEAAMRFRTFAILMLAGMVITACGGSGSNTVPATQQGSSRNASSSSSPIQHVVIIVQENRTFNDFFATYPGGDGTTVGKIAANPNCSPPIKAGTIPLAEVPLNVPKDLVHSYHGYLTARDGRKMDGFDLVRTTAAFPSALSHTNTPSRRRSCRTGTWPSSTRWRSTCSRLTAATASTRIRT